MKSMTGFGSVTHEDEAYSSIIEIKSLNSKFLDCSVRLPKIFSNKEIEVRNIVQKKLERGKVSVSIDFSIMKDEELKQTVNQELFEQYYSEYQELANKVGAPTQDIFKLALQAPDVLSNGQETNDYEEEWKVIQSELIKAIDQCDEFRIQEGESLREKVNQCIEIIGTLLEEVVQLDPQRVENIRQRLGNNLEEWVGQEEIDKNRLEQELIYYIEKLDIAEEITRLKNHLAYWKEVAGQEGPVGKKLGFVSQEIGREINTLGSKANDSTIQRLVVSMKEELEKIKEQVANIL